MATIITNSHVVDWAVMDGKRLWSAVKLKIRDPLGLREGEYDLTIIWLSHVRDAAGLARLTND